MVGMREERGENLQCVGGTIELLILTRSLSPLSLSRGSTTTTITVEYTGGCGNCGCCRVEEYFILNIFINPFNMMGNHVLLKFVFD